MNAKEASMEKWEEVRRFLKNRFNLQSYADLRLLTLAEWHNQLIKRQCIFSQQLNSATQVGGIDLYSQLMDSPLAYFDDPDSPLEDAVDTIKYAKLRSGPAITEWQMLDYFFCRKQETERPASYPKVLAEFLRQNALLDGTFRPKSDVEQHRSLSYITLQTHAQSDNDDYRHHYSTYLKSKNKADLFDQSVDLKISMSATDQVLKEQFGEWLKSKRAELLAQNMQTSSFKDTSKSIFTTKRIGKWIEYRALQYLDLLIITKGKFNCEPVNNQLSYFLFSDVDEIFNPTDKLRPVKKYAAQIQDPLVADAMLFEISHDSNNAI